MAIISSNSFDPLNSYSGIRLQQGVPIADRDWNEQEDIYKFAFRAFLKWFVGNGIPEGLNSFQIESTGAPDNFMIRAGAVDSIISPPGGESLTDAQKLDNGLNRTGHCLVDGMDIQIAADLGFIDQPLYPDNPASDTEQARLNVPKIAPIPILNETGPVVVYLDIWERLVTPTENPNLVLPGLGVETCARLKREWVVRVQSGAMPPASPEGHHHYALARINRRINQIDGAPQPQPIEPADIEDLRQQQLTMAGIANRLSFLESVLLLPRFNPPPNEFNPKFGAAGSSVILFGQNLNISTPTVRFNNVEAPLVNAPTANQITVTVPSMPEGNVTISIQTPGGTATSVDTFAVLASSTPPAPPPAFDPSPNQFNPKFGTGGTDVILLGTNFDVESLTVRFGTTTAAIIGAPTSTQITARVPPMGAGAVQITVETAGGTVVSDDVFSVI